jgi:hypothetical protein
VVVESHQQRDPPSTRLAHQAYGEMDQVLEMKNLRPELVEDLEETRLDGRVPIGLLEAAEDVVVDDLVGRHAAMAATPERVVGRLGADLRVEEPDRVLSRQTAGELVGIDLHPGHVVRKEVVDYMEDAHGSARSLY